jgi:NAD(P)-dependent dehydrogenase (short-subunit alcohol dehydrogenase family)
MNLVLKTVLITGASRGLGKHLARHFFDKGSNVILVARNAGSLHNVLEGLSIRDRQRIEYLECDLADADSVSKLCEKIVEFPIDTLINNAAIQGPIGPLATNAWDAWNETIQVNLLAPVALCRALSPQLISNNSGSIINLSGGGATSARANLTAYATAKAGLVRFSETLAVRVNCIAPGPMQTDMLREVLKAGHDLAGDKEFNAAQKVLAQSNSPFQKVAELCEFLSLEKSEGISGKLISALWDPWEKFDSLSDQLKNSDICTLRRIVPEDRQQTWAGMAESANGSDRSKPH